MKKLIITVCLLMTMLGAFVPTIHAQEFIKESDGISVRKSIIREVEQNKWLVYDEIGNLGVFTMFTDTGTTSTIMYMPYDSYFVNDFEIANGIVYFCGECQNQNTPYAVIGTFSLFSFPSTNILCYILPATRRFTKMELLNDHGTQRYIMIGETLEGGYQFVDAKISPLQQCVFYVSDLDEEYGKVLDDIAVTDSFAVFTSRNPMNNSGWLYYFQYPPMYGSIFDNTMEIRKMCADAQHPLLIEHCEGDAFVVASTRKEFFLNNYLDIRAYNGLSHIVSISSEKKNERDGASCIDLKYNRYRRELDVLTVLEWSPAEDLSPYFSYIHHFDQSLVSGGVSTVHCYNGERLQSFDFLKNNGTVTTEFIASGFDISLFLKLYRYRSNVWGQCTSKEERTVSIKGDDTKDTRYMVPSTRYTEPRIIVETWFSDRPLSTRCPWETE